MGCPALGCNKIIDRQRNTFQREDKFRCPLHKIYISPTTFEYQNESDNLLWQDSADLELLKNIKTMKRESRMARDNSEDALTWNVFRFLEKNHLLEKTLSPILGIPLRSSEIIYWSYSQKDNASWPDLNEARRKFGEQIRRGSEPDTIIKADGKLLFIEAKLTANNETVPTNVNNTKKYEESDKAFFSQVFQSDFNTIAIQEKKYELLRFWLLGNWLAAQRDLDFYLINLVLKKKEQTIETIFRKYLHQNQRMKFIRITWEDLYSQILSHSVSETGSNKIINYFKNKTIGYDGAGRLQKAFSIP